MAEVQIAIGGRAYAVHCRDGEEPRLHQLARMISERVDKVKLGSPGITEVRQLLFAALFLADELTDSQLEAQTQSRRATGQAPTDGDALAGVIESLAERLEALSEGLAVEGSRA